MMSEQISISLKISVESSRQCANRSSFSASLRVRTANDAFYLLFELEKQDTEGRLFYEIGIAGAWNIPGLRQLMEDLLPRESSLRNFEIERQTHAHYNASGIHSDGLSPSRRSAGADRRRLVIT